MTMVLCFLIDKLITSKEIHLVDASLLLHCVDVRSSVLHLPGDKKLSIASKGVKIRTYMMIQYVRTWRKDEQRIFLPRRARYEVSFWGNLKLALAKEKDHHLRYQSKFLDNRGIQIFVKNPVLSRFRWAFAYWMKITVIQERSYKLKRIILNLI